MYLLKIWVVFILKNEKVGIICPTISQCTHGFSSTVLSKEYRRKKLLSKVDWTFNLRIVNKGNKIFSYYTYLWNRETNIINCAIHNLFHFFFSLHDAWSNKEFFKKLKQQCRITDFITHSPLSKANPASVILDSVRCTLYSKLLILND